MPTLDARSVRLRPARPDDAAFILGLRLDERLNRHLSPVADDVERQRAWLTAYQDREAAGQEYYFVIERPGGEPCGTVRVYDFRGPSFCWGSWILRPGSPPTAAIESTLAVYEFGYFDLGFARCHFDVRKDNAKVVKYHEWFGATRVREDEANLYYELTREAYLAVRPRFARYLPPAVAERLA